MNDQQRPEATPGLHVDEAWISSEPSTEARALIEQHARAGRKDSDRASRDQLPRIFHEPRDID